MKILRNIHSFLHISDSLVIWISAVFLTVKVLSLSPWNFARHKMNSNSHQTAIVHEVTLRCTKFLKAKQNCSKNHFMGKYQKNACLVDTFGGGGAVRIFYEMLLLNVAAMQRYSNGTWA